MSKAIVLGADSGYLDQLTTTIKSVSAHNREITFYVLNDDLSQEWFQVINQYLRPLDSRVVNIPMSRELVSHYTTPKEHISTTAYFRYFIPNVIKEERVLYLDSDIIVTGSLEELFMLDMGDYALAAVPDIPTVPEGFNSGVLLMDLVKWRQQDIPSHLVTLTAEHHEHAYGDQHILNMYFEQEWLKLDLTYNLQVGSDSQQYLAGDMEWYHTFEGVPRIIHYTIDKKPWKQLHFNRFRELWWFYYGLDWEDIVLRKDILKRDFQTLVDGPRFHAVTFTNTAHIAHYEELIQALPDVQFHIGAHSFFGAEVMDLQRFPNLTIYPCFDPLMQETLLQKMDVYLDINYNEEILEATKRAHELGKPVLSFDATNHDSSEQNVQISIAHPEEMIQTIRTYKDK